MIWVAWRQQRAVLLSLAAYAAVLIAVLVYLHVRLVLASDVGVTLDCWPNGPGSICAVNDHYWDLRGKLQFWHDSTHAATLGFAVLAGAFVGAPMIAREWEQRTHLLVQGQSIGLRRWFATRLAVVLAATVAGAALLGGAQWWAAEARPDPLETWKRLQPTYFEVQPVALIGYTLFAVALGITAGLVLRRSLPAMAVTLLGVVGAVYAVRTFARPDYMTPVVSVGSFAGSNGRPTDPGRWSLASGWGDRDGRFIEDRSVTQEVIGLCNGRPGSGSPDTFQRCLAEHGIVGPANLVHPGDRFWPFQFIEFGLFAAAACLLITLSLWWLRKRSV
ncbi:hypothetical protein [Saccharothrix sp. NRRL B-16314]|uniref:hypothetical protein n=1 Tax=Saccharothrix sp. NRRL B-16314 TaxID=1463825 RepID=UPI00052567C0|nr:hypothetical protein [Saccharothrix sp. NRRL B-16314]